MLDVPPDGERGGGRAATNGPFGAKGVGETGDVLRLAGHRAMPSRMRVGVRAHGAAADPEAVLRALARQGDMTLRQSNWDDE